MEKDLVSIIMPSYNTASYIEESIKSVLNQTYSKWELIIVDDCSSDNTAEIIRKINDERIVFIQNTKNRGAAYSRNLALRKARGEWIAFLDSDDVWINTKLVEQIEFMKEKNVSFSYTKYQEMDEKGTLLGKMVYGPKHISKRLMFTYCWPGCLTVMYDAGKVGLIQIENLKKNNDYAIWLKAIGACDCYLLEKDLARYRKRVGSISNVSYAKLIKYHYLLFRQGEKMSPLEALIFCGLNIIGGAYKKIFYVKSINR